MSQEENQDSIEVKVKDPILLKELLRRYDTNKDQVLQKRETDKITKVSLSPRMIKSAGFFRSAVWEYPNITSLEGTEQFSNLKEITIFNNTIKEIDLNGYKALTKVVISHCNLTELSLLNLPKLENVTLYESSVIGEIIIKSIPQLESLFLSNHDTYYLPTKLSIVDLPKLKDLELYHIKISELELHQLKSLLNFKTGNKVVIKKMNCKSLTKLESLEVNDRELESITIKDLEHLNKISLDDNSINTLELKELPSLTELSLNNALITDTLFIQSLPKLWLLHVSQNKTIKYIEIKETPINTLQARSNPLLKNINLETIKLNHLSVSYCELLQTVVLCKGSPLYTKYKDKHTKIKYYNCNNESRKQHKKNEKKYREHRIRDFTSDLLSHSYLDGGFTFDLYNWNRSRTRDTRKGYSSGNLLLNPGVDISILSSRDYMSDVKFEFGGGAMWGMSSFDISRTSRSFGVFSVPTYVGIRVDETFGLRIGRQFNWLDLYNTDKNINGKNRRGDTYTLEVLHIAEFRRIPDVGVYARAGYGITNGAISFNAGFRLSDF